MSKCFQDTLLMLVGLEHSFIRYDYGIYLADWSAGSRLQTDLLSQIVVRGSPNSTTGIPARRACGTNSRHGGWLGDERILPNTNNRKVLLGFLGAPVRAPPSGALTRRPR